VNREPAIALAISRVVTGRRQRRVPLRDLLVAAASVDHTAASSVGWRARVLTAIVDLADEGVIELPRTRLDRTAHPPLPAYVTRPAAPRPEASPPETVVWHADLSWVAVLDQEGALSAAERRLLTAVNEWLPRRRDIPVPLRERSLELLGDEKELERWVLGPLFGPGRLSMDQLDCFPCWPPVEQTHLGPGDWLLIENYTTYVSIADRAMDAGFDGRVVWGSGNQVGTRLSALTATGAARPDHCWYFGDIDAGGFRAARLAVARATELGIGPVHPARGLYRLALRGQSRRTGKTSAETAAWAQVWLGGPLGDEVAEIVRAGKRIVQEHVGVEVLRTVDVAAWFGD
jgi:hypothetical protein